MEVCNCSMFCCTLLYVHSSIAIILMGKRELIALLNLSFWCLVMVERLFLTVPRGSLQFVIVVFPDHTHILFFKSVKTHNIGFLKTIGCLNQTKCFMMMIATVMDLHGIHNLCMHSVHNPYLHCLIIHKN